jgi:hypothetical protein
LGTMMMPSPLPVLFVSALYRSIFASILGLF